MDQAAAQEARPARPDDGAGVRFVDDYLLYLLARASHVVSAQFHAFLAERDVPVPVWRVLASLTGAGPLTVGELARVVLLKQSTLTKVVDRLVASDLVRRTGVPEDRRQVLIGITETGDRLVQDLLVQAKAHEASILAELTPAETAGLKHALFRLIERFDPPKGGSQGEPNRP